MKARTRLTLTLILASIVGGAGPALAQDTRADAMRRQQSERQQHLSAPETTMF
jgi:hypothetical protein